jgi:GT2 family glycosyltransferase
VTVRPAISGVVVCWGDPSPLLELLAAWPDDPRFELVVVDNGPFGDAGHEAVWERVRRRARVVTAGRNLGFGGGANAGARAARGEVLLVLNPDARPEPGALAALAEGFARHPEAAGLAPRLLGGDGAGQWAWQLRRLPGAAQLLLQALGVPAVPEAAVEPAAGAAVEQPAAAALALRRDAWDAAGGFDPAFHPAWFEDVDLAARLGAGGRRLLYWPAAVFRHGLGGTVAQLGYGRFLWAYQRNLVLYLGKHHGRAAAALARLLLPLGLLSRLVLLPVRTPKRARGRAGGARGLLSALKGALSGWRRPERWREDGQARKGGERPGGARASGEAPGGSLLPGEPDRGTAAGSPDRPERIDQRREAEPGGDHVPEGAPLVRVCIVTRGAEADVGPCFAAVAALEHRPLEVVVVDCASSDGTVAEVARNRPVLESADVPLLAVPLPDNRGFAGGMNAALAAAVPERAPASPTFAEPFTTPAEAGPAAPRADGGAAPPPLSEPFATSTAITPYAWALSLNADARPAPDYVSRLLARAAVHPELRVGAVTGRLLRPRQAGRPPVLDACGMRLTRTWRHLDRGSGEVDSGQYGGAERVFGATGAASLFRRAALADAALDGDPFDPLFHSFREDAELAFRLRERGWEVLYEPAARAEHRRFNLPGRRAAMPPEVNLHSLKNRYLLRLVHQTPRNLIVTLLPALLRDAAALGWVVVAERSSLAAYRWLWRNRRPIAARRRAVQARRLVPARELDHWFGRDGMPL